MNKFIKKGAIYFAIVFIVMGVYNIVMKLLQPYTVIQASQMQLQDNYDGFVATQVVNAFWNSASPYIVSSLVILFVIMFYKDITMSIKKLFKS